MYLNIRIGVRRNWAGWPSALSAQLLVPMFGVRARGSLEKTTCAGRPNTSLRVSLSVMAYINEPFSLGGNGRMAIHKETNLQWKIEQIDK